MTLLNDSSSTSQEHDQTVMVNSGAAGAFLEGDGAKTPISPER